MTGYRWTQRLSPNLTFNGDRLSTLVLRGTRYADGRWCLDFLYCGEVLAQAWALDGLDPAQAWLLAVDAIRMEATRVGYALQASENASDQLPAGEWSSRLAGVLVLSSGSFSPVPDDLGPVADIWRGSPAPPGGDGYRKGD